MRAPDPRLEEIEGRNDRALLHENLNASDYAAMAWESVRDVPYLLAELRKAQDKLERVEGLHRPIFEDGEPVGCEVCDWEHSDGAEWPCKTRAAVADATGGGK